MNAPIILLDLNYTLVENCDDPENQVPFPDRITGHRYRTWLIDMVRPYRVFILTARPDTHRERTLADIKTKTGWQPERYYGNVHNQPPPEAKRQMLIRHLLPEFGTPPNWVPDERSVLPGAERVMSPFLGIESNPRTRTMYAKYSIPSLPCLDLKPKTDLTLLWKSLATGPSRTDP